MRTSFANVFKAIESLSKKQGEKTASEVMGEVEKNSFIFHWTAPILRAVFQHILEINDVFLFSF